MEYTKTINNVEITFTDSKVNLANAKQMASYKFIFNGHEHGGSALNTTMGSIESQAEAHILGLMKDRK